MALLGNINDWFKNNGDYTHRLDYDLNGESIVFDLGGYQGWFVEQISKKHDCKIYCFEPLPQYANKIKETYSENKKVKVFTLGVSDEIKTDTIYLNNDASSAYVKTDTPVKVKTTTIDKIMNDEGIEFVDLIKINIEGEEYPLLEYIINNNLQSLFGNIQVQFHRMGENYSERYDKIVEALEKTHELTYKYSFVWENWELKK